MYVTQLHIGLFRDGLQECQGHPFQRLSAAEVAYSMEIGLDLNDARRAKCPTNKSYLAEAFLWGLVSQVSPFR